MRELQITDADLQKLLAPTIRKYLRKAGFKMGAPSGAEPPSYFFPINLELAGDVTVTRREDGTWSFTQETDLMLIERTAESGFAHASACTGTWR
jgi:hypothetical protein